MSAGATSLQVRYSAGSPFSSYQPVTFDIPCCFEVSIGIYGAQVKKAFIPFPKNMEFLQRIGGGNTCVMMK